MSTLKAKSQQNMTTSGTKRSKNLIPLGWLRLIRADASNNNANKHVVYTSPSGVELTSIQAIKTYLLADNTCKCGLECPLNIHEVFSFDAKIKHSSVKLNNSHKHKCAVFKAETSVLKKLKKKMGVCGSVMPTQSLMTTSAAQQSLLLAKKYTKSCENSNESFDEAKLSHILLAGYLNGEDTSSSFTDLNKSSSSQVMSMFGVNQQHEMNQDHGSQNKSGNGEITFNFSNTNTNTNNGQDLDNKPVTFSSYNNNNSSLEQTLADVNASNDVGAQSQGVYQKQACNSLIDNFYNMKMNQIDYQNTLNFENEPIYVNFSSADIKSEYAFIFVVVYKKIPGLIIGLIFY